MTSIIRQLHARTFWLNAAIAVLLVIVFFGLPLSADAQKQEVQLDIGFIEGALYRMATAIGGVFLWLSGSLLDLAIESLVIGMGNWINHSALGNTINALWTVIRDIFNIFFIFGLIYVGLQTIWDAKNTNTQRLVVMLIAAALLINFSLYFTKVIIDFSNVAAYQIHRLIRTPEEGSPNAGQLTGITDTFMQYSSLTSYADPNAELLNKMSEDAGWLPSGRVIAYAFLMMIFMLIAAFVFLAGAFLLIGRFIALIIFMIFSPVLFLGWILPAFAARSKKWWHDLINYAFVAPAFLFMIYLSLAVLQQYDVAGGSFAAAFDPNSTTSGLFSVFLNFFVIIGFLWASLMVARQMGGMAATHSIGIAQGVQKRIQGGARLVAGYAGRKSVGRYADKRDQELEKRGVSSTDPRRRLAASLAKSKFGGTFSQREVREAGEKASAKKARYDQTQDVLQKIKATTTGNATDDQRIEMERAVAGASTEQLLQILGDKDEKNPEYKAAVAAMSASQFDGVMKSKDEDFNDEQKTRLAAARKTTTEDALRRIANKAHQRDTGDENAELGEEEALKKGLGKASGPQLKALGGATLTKYAGDLTPSQIDDIKKSSDYTETEKSRILEAYDKQLEEMFKNDPATVFARRKDKEIAKLPKGILTNKAAVPYLSGSVLKQILDDDTLTESDRDKIVDNLTSGNTEKNKSAMNYLSSPHGLNFSKMLPQ